MIELWFHYLDDAGYLKDLDTDIVANVPCVPRIGEVVETSLDGACVVVSVKYDYHKDNGQVRVHIEVSRHKIQK